MLTLTSLSGTAGNPITIRALNDGGPLVDGQFGIRPLDCAGSYITVQGVNFKDGNDTVGAIRGKHCAIQRTVAWSTQSLDGINNIFDLGGSHNLLEDCGAFGYARKLISAGSRGGPGPNTVRRCWAEFNGSMPGSQEGNPTNVFEAGYDQDNVTFENVIATRDVLTAATEPEAPLTVFSTRYSALLGSIAYAKAGQTWDTTSLMAVFPEGGSHAGSGHVNTGVLLQDLVFVVAPAHTQIGPFWVQGGSGSAGNVMQRVVSVTPGGSGASCGNALGWVCEGLHAGTTLAQATGGQSVFTLLPGLCTRYVNRVLTTTPLWPWPMTERIVAARGAAKMPARNVTRSIEEILGPIPAQCRSDTPPPEPEPAPPPGPHAPLVCTGTVAAVPGQVALRCIPEAVRR